MENWSETLSDTSIQRHRQAWQRRADHFIAGPIPVTWVAQAAKVNSTAALVGLALWFRAGCEKSRTIKAGRSLWSRFNISRYQAHRALLALQSAGLVTIQRRRGQNLVVTILASRSASLDFPQGGVAKRARS